MRISFFAGHPYYGGLGNTGGSRTIVRSTAALRGLGHEVDIVAPSDRFTWEKHPPVKRKLGAADVVIAVSISDLKLLLKLMPSAHLAYWMRGWEQWQMSHDDIFAVLRKAQARGVALYTNSGWLERKLSSNGLRSRTAWAGMDFELFNTEGRPPRVEGAPPVVGCLYPASGKRTYHHKSKGWKIAERIRDAVPAPVRMQAYGRSPKGPSWLDHYEPEPTGERLKRFYHSCDIWLSTSWLEGFHNPPAEAVLCGCLPVVFNCSSGGTRDYCRDEGSHQFLEIDEAVRAICRPDYRRIGPARAKLEAIGDRRTCMQRFVNYLEQEFEL